ncbi:MAG TPA: hypothetical protein DHV51_04425 [Opitutae bacterium]|nr:hypothetical protein [Opitutae bacterium]
MLRYVVIVFWLFAGIFGRHPWKPDEAYTTGLVWSMAHSHDYVVPTLAGEPFMEKPPFYYMTAAWIAQLMPALSFHESARLASVLFNLITLLSVALSARRLFGGGGLNAAILFAGSAGVLVNAHFLITDVGLLAGFALALLGGLFLKERPWLGGLLLGTGTGIGFLTKGLIAPGVLGVVFALLPLVSREGRTKAYFGGALVAVLSFLPWGLIWPYLLWKRDSGLFMEWFWVNNLGRYFGFSGGLGPRNEYLLYVKMLPWYAFPAILFAPLALWRQKLDYGRRLLLLFFGVFLIVLSISHDGRQLYAMPIVLPCVILGAGIDWSRWPRLNEVLRWLFFALFAFVGALIWAGYILYLFQWPATLANALNTLEPGFVPQLGWLLWPAIVMTAVWCFCKKRDAIFTWAAGITLVWTLVMTLWLPFIDYGKRYSDVFGELNAHMPLRDSPILSLRLGEPQRACLDYYHGIQTRRLERFPRSAQQEMKNAPIGTILIAQRSLDGIPLDQWSLLWQGSRPGDVSTQEIFCLLQKK